MRKTAVQMREKRVTCVGGGQCSLDRAAKKDLLMGRRLMGEVNEEACYDVAECSVQRMCVTV